MMHLAKEAALWALLLWALALMVHMVWEACWIIFHYPEPLDACGHWWCPQTWAIAWNKWKRL